LNNGIQQTPFLFRRNRRALPHFAEFGAALIRSDERLQLLKSAAAIELIPEHDIHEGASVTIGDG
jgi:hypothetical protein